MISQIHELIQFQNHLLGQAHFTDKQHKKGPAPKPEKVVRPHETFGRVPQEVVPEFDDDEWLTPDDMRLRDDDTTE